ncbi:MAG TPA: formate dehydrogenase accessory protein FdhE [Nocardioidaceae bacterium]|nr:formate dehydrogenase accessory protein FdhE [Nocardioidaceae bacterium]
MAMPRVETTPWAAPRRRAEDLHARHDFATDVLTLYVALVDVWETAWADARSDLTTSTDGSAPPERLAAWAADRVLPRVVSATAEAGPKPLVEQLMTMPIDDRSGAEQLVAAWLRGEDLEPVERYLARSTTRGPLEAVDAGSACAADPSSRGDRRCPDCGGPPQVSVRADTGDALVNGSRQLQCARCGGSWAFSGSTCAACGESRGGRRTVYAEQRDGPQVGRGSDGEATLPHLRIEACATCQRYLIDVDLGRDPQAVPEVDELAALPLDLYAAERGLSKITPNVMGF